MVQPTNVKAMRGAIRGMQVPKTANKAKKRRKAKGMPKRPLSAYNVFFHRESQRMIKQPYIQHLDFSHRDNGVAVSASNNSREFSDLAGLARCISAKWKTLPPQERGCYEAESRSDHARYWKEMDEWKRSNDEQHLIAAHQHQKESVLWKGDAATRHQIAFESCRSNDKSALWMLNCRDGHRDLKDAARGREAKTTVSQPGIVFSHCDSSIESSGKSTSATGLVVTELTPHVLHNGKTQHCDEGKNCALEALVRQSILWLPESLPHLIVEALELRQQLLRHSIAPESLTEFCDSSFRAVTGCTQIDFGQRKIDKEIVPILPKIDACPANGFKGELPSISSLPIISQTDESKPTILEFAAGLGVSSTVSTGISREFYLAPSSPLTFSGRISGQAGLITKPLPLGSEGEEQHNDHTVSSLTQRCPFVEMKNGKHSETANCTSRAEAASLRQLMTELDEEDQTFIVSLRDS